MTNICIIRHGETDANRNFIVQGRMDNPLNKNGIEQARKTGLYLRDNHETFDVFITSPLKRAFDTAKIIAQTLGQSKPVNINFDLIERNFGDYDGKQIDEDYQRLILSDAIPNIEKNHILENRVIGALDVIVRKYEGKNVLIVAHSHVIKAILIKFLPGFTYTSFLANCSINLLTWDNGVYTVLRHNINPLL